MMTGLDFDLDCKDEFELEEYYERHYWGNPKKKWTEWEELVEFHKMLSRMLEIVPYYKNKNYVENDDDYLLSSDDESPAEKKRKLAAMKKCAPKKSDPKNSDSDDDNDDVGERIASIKNKLRQKKRPTTERAQKKREAKQLKRSKGVQKLLLSSAKSLKNESIKQNKIKKGAIETFKEEEEPETKKSAESVYNEDAKIVYSKIDFAGKTKKSHKNPRELLKKLKDTRKQINELKESGETDKAAEIQNDIAWKKAFEKVEGKKVKDDPKLLVKAIKKRKVEKKKAKTKWNERKQKVDQDQAKRQKKRQENLDKRSKDKKNKKLKKASKRGRIIAGY